MGTRPEAEWVDRVCRDCNREECECREVECDVDPAEWDALDAVAARLEGGAA